jgi:hypothetical protein
LNGSNVISRMANAGIFTGSNTSLLFASNTNEFSYNTTGIECSPNIAYLVTGPASTPGAFLGNGTDLVGCPGADTEGDTE